MNSGIYRIRNLINQKIYVGSTINFKNRWKKHKIDLRKRKHHSISLQRAWNKYGEQNFVFDILEFIENEFLLVKREQYYLDLLNPFKNTGYNICRIAGSCLGRKHKEETKKKMGLSRKRENLSKETLEKMSLSQKGRKHSKETKEKIGKASRGKPFRGGHRCWLGRKHTQETKKKISKINSGKFIGEKSALSKLTWDDVEKIRNIYKKGNVSHLELSIIFGVKEPAIWKILNFKTWRSK